METATTETFLSTPSSGRRGEEATSHQLCAFEMFESHARRKPEAVALAEGDLSMSYRQLNECANYLAERIRAAGARPETVVALLAEQGFVRITGVLAIHKAGAAYLPLNPRDPEARLCFQIEDSGAAFLVTERGLSLPVACPIIEIDPDAREAQNPRPAVSGVDHLAYVIYTSGSTGTPKGALLAHRGLATLIRFTGGQMHIGSGDRILQFASFTFDVSIWEIYSALAHGATLVLVDRGPLQPGPELHELIRKQAVTIFLLSPSILQVLPPRGLEGVRIVVTGIEKCTKAIAERWAQGRHLFNTYGPTETTIYSTIVEVDPNEDGDPSIGFPVPGTHCVVLASSGLEAAPGELGELLIAGEGVARGYMNRPELSAEKFVWLLLGGVERRYYRTGDRVRRRLDGALEFFGRMDRQMKIRGFRVEPAEIENCLDGRPDVASSTVVARSDPNGGSDLVAFFIPAPGHQAPTKAMLSAHLSRTLPDYLVPARFVQKTEWPLTDRGKLDRQALLDELEAYPLREPEVSPSSAEGRLRVLCRKAIGASPAGLDDSLIELGLHSLSAANLAWLIQEEFQTSLRLSEVLKEPTLGTLLALIKRHSGNVLVANRPPLGEAITRPSLLPLSFSQEQVWFLEKLHPHLNAYRFQALFHCRGELDVEDLEATLNRIVSRHEILRTAFVGDDGGAPRQDVRPYVPFRLVTENLEALSTETRHREMERLIQGELRRRFDPSCPPLIRWRLFRLGNRDYKLLHTEHHFLHDGWSYAEFLRELFTIYTVLSNGIDPPVETAPMQFADFALWQRKMMAAGAWDAQIDFWKRELEGCPPPPLMPSDRRITGARTFEGLQIRCGFPETLWDDVGRAASREGVTRFAWIQAAFQLFVHRYTSAEDFCVGSGFANRQDPRSHGMLGMVINTLPLRARFHEIGSFFELARAASNTLRKASDNQDVSLKSVVQLLNPTRATDANPFFNTFIGSFENPLPQLQSNTLEITSDDAIACGQVKFDIVALVLPRGHGTRAGTPARSPVPQLIWEFSSELFDFETGERMLEHFLQLLENSVRDPGVSICSLPMISDEEERRLVALGKAPFSELPDLSIDQLFEAVAASRPNAPAIIWDGGSLGYGELSERSWRLARYLRDQGVEDGARVALCMDRSPELVIGMLSVLKAGGTYVPLDPGYPNEHLRFILEDANVVAILTVAKASEMLPQGAARVIVIDRDWRFVETGGGEVACKSNLGDIAYVIYTSGSTGAPKGVAVPHCAITRLVLNTNYVELGPKDRIAHLSNVCFDAATFEIWGALLNGASVVIIPKTVALDSKQFGEELRRHQVSTLFVTTALFNELAAVNGRIFQGIKQVLFGGEAVNPESVRRVVESGRPPRRLLHVYGPTECTTFATFYPVTHVEKDAATIPIGRPISNTTAYVLDKHGNPQPIGVPGELYLGGPGVAQGYLNEPELTRERFVADAFSTDKSQRLYRTGDIVKLLADGNLEFIGRADEQVKIRGFRIEPGEVEAVLKHHPGVQDTIVVAREDEPEERRLVAYVVLKKGEAARDWVDLLKRKLPDYMIPSAFILLNKLPLTANGKVDRRALPVPSPGRELEGYRAPRTPQEEVLCGLFEEVLQLKRVGIEDNFFAMGGHSLSATRLVSRVRPTFGVELAIRTFFEAPTVAELATHLHTGEALRLPLVVRPQPERLPLSYAQQRLWFLAQLEGPSATYNIPIALRLEGNLDADALEVALADVVERHESLRTIFPEQDGVPFQQILPAEQARLALVMEEVGEAAVGSRLIELAATSIDLSREIPVRAWLLRLEPHCHVLLLLLHHIAADGWSMGPLAQDLAQAYSARRVRQAPAYAELPVQYADYSLWQRQLLGEESDSGSLLSKQLDFWRKALSGLPEELNLPADRARPALMSYRGARVSVELNAELHRGLRELARASGTSLFMVLQAGLAALLSRLGCGEDIPIGAPIAGRGEGALENLVGFFVNTLVLRTDVSGDPSFRELLARVRSFDLEAYAQQDVPFERVVEALRPTRSRARHALFQVMLALQNTQHAELVLPGLVHRVEEFSLGVTKFDLALSLGERLGRHGEPLGIAATLGYSLDLFEQGRAEEIAARFVRLLEAAVATPDVPLHRLDILSAGERHRLLEEFNNSARPVPEATLPELFEAQVERDPEAIAVIFGEESLTYQELNARANALAHHLIGLGVGPESLMGIALERSIEMLVALLGVLKAGGAYLPLDLDYPPARLAHMLEDAAPILVLGTSPLRSRLPESLDLICLDELEIQSAGGQAPCHNPRDEERIAALLPQHPAYVIYTSGSTGRPNGVVVEHRAIATHSSTVAKHYELSAADRVMQFASLSFDGAAEQIFSGLLSGACLVMRGNEIWTSRECQQKIRKLGVSVMNLPPAYWGQLVRDWASEEEDRESTVRLVIVGGEVMPPESIELWRRSSLRMARLLNAYGPTEATVAATTFELTAEGATPSGHIPIGRPLAGRRAYVLDRWLEPVPIGVAGELYLAGAGLARGYLKRPELTAERFVADLYGEPGSRMYRTGDLARWRNDGTLEFLGRVDHQVKIRGFRIELGEIEAVLRQHPSVAAASVIVREDGNGDKQLVAYLAAGGSGRQPEPGRLREFLRRKLPDYMVPSAFVVLEKLPLTANGKIDRNSLPPPVLDREGVDFVAPCSETERAVAEAWSAVLNVQEIGVYDNFFQLGGHSLLATRAVSRLRNIFGFEIPLRVLFENATVAAIAEFIDGAQWTASGAPFTPAVPDHEEITI